MMRSGAVHVQIDHENAVAYVINVNPTPDGDAVGVAGTRRQLLALAASLRHAADVLVRLPATPFTEHHRCAADADDTQ